MEIPEWKEFEIAVANFVRALDPNAVVKYNVKLPDAHTETPRQRDVWVETKVLQHFPVKICISCKKETKKLDQQDIDAFHGELLSSGAHLGVIYSYSGFGVNAINKSKAIGKIYCCRLYQNEPPDIPEHLFFPNSYCCTPRLSLSISEPFDSRWNIKTWNELFTLKINSGQITVLDAIEEVYLNGEKEAAKSITPIPPIWAKSLKITEELPPNKSIVIIIQGLWNIYESKIEACLMNGSYCFSTGGYTGTQSTPAIDLHGTHPGPGWTLLKSPPTEATSSFIRCILLGGNLKEALTGKLGVEPITTVKLLKENN